MENEIDELLKKLESTTDYLDEDKIRKQIYAEEVRRNDAVRKNAIATSEALVRLDEARVQRDIDNQHRAASRHQDWLDECARNEEFRQSITNLNLRTALALESIAAALQQKG